MDQTHSILFYSPFCHVRWIPPPRMPSPEPTHNPSPSAFSAGPNAELGQMHSSSFIFFYSSSSWLVRK